MPCRFCHIWYKVSLRCCHTRNKSWHEDAVTYVFKCHEFAVKHYIRCHEGAFTQDKRFHESDVTLKIYGFIVKLLSHKINGVMKLLSHTWYMVSSWRCCHTWYKVSWMCCQIWYYNYYKNNRTIVFYSVCNSLTKDLIKVNKKIVFRQILNHIKCIFYKLKRLIWKGKLKKTIIK